MSAALDLTATEAAERLRPLVDDGLLAFDVDGVLAPLVDHADDARLSDGVAESLDRLAARAAVAIVSGRSLESLDRCFAFGDAIHVIGSHGLEVRGQGAAPLDDDEQYTFEQLEIIGTKGVDAAGDGAWLEYKPAGVVMHTRTADPALVEPAARAVTNLARMIDGAVVKSGSNVIELFARSADKGTALSSLADRLGRRPVGYLGDDVTDEDAFRVLSGDDVSIRVGDGDTAARFRMSGPAAVADMLASLARG